MARRVADCTLCGRTGMGLVTNFSGSRKPDGFRIAIHNRPDGGRCMTSTPEAGAIYEVAGTPRSITPPRRPRVDSHAP